VTEKLKKLKGLEAEFARTAKIVKDVFFAAWYFSIEIRTLIQGVMPHADY
jgi:hypothetical protein